MMNVDLDLSPKWDEIFRHVEAGEAVQVMRGGQLVALVQPSTNRDIDDAYLGALGALGVQRLAEITSHEDFADWD